MTSDPLEEWYRKIVVTSWDELQKVLAEQLPSALGRLPGRQERWIFRGQPKAEYLLETTLDRYFRRTYEPDELVGPEYGSAAEWRAAGIDPACPYRPHLLKELDMTTTFERRFRSLATSHPIPDEKAYFEWRALIRHYGGPCRLIDFTYSFYVALFFALDEAEGDAAVWAVQPLWLDQEIHRTMPEVLRTLRSYLSGMEEKAFWKMFGGQYRFVRALEPYYLNDRLISQQGVFLCPGDVSVPFYQNLLALLIGGPQKPEIAIRREKAQTRFAKLVVSTDRKSCRHILSHLCDMNVTRAVLFPGVEGLAGSLTQTVAVRSLGESVDQLAA